MANSVQDRFDDEIFDVANALEVRQWPKERVISQWRSQFGIDVSRFFEDIDEIRLLRCPSTGILFFDPLAAGDESIYSALQERDWYYLAEKWEYERTLRSADRPERILEVGCGSGAFLRIAQTHGHHCFGLELNSQAVLAAKESGLHVKKSTIEKFAHSRPAEFDRVVAFQVLEHVRNPFALLACMAKCAKPGGRISVAVPNADSFIRHAEMNLLDMPPHHVTRWQPDTLEKIGKNLGLTCVSIAAGPLEYIHIDWFLKIVLRDIRFRRVLLNRITLPLLRAVLNSGGRHLIRGHSIYAEYLVPKA